MSAAGFVPSLCEQVVKEAREDKGQLVSSVTALLFNYYFKSLSVFTAQFMC